MRTKKKKNLRWRIFTFLALSLAVLIALGYFLSLPIWKIQEVTVNGAKILSAEEIRDLSSVPLNENLFFTSLARTRNNLRKITAIKSFHLYRIPPATILISLVERQPLAVVVISGQSAIIDQAGYILNRNPNITVNIPNLTDLPVISGLSKEELIANDQLSPKAAQLIAEIINELSALLGSRRLQIELGGFARISFVLDDILRVKLGRDEEVKLKLAVFRELLKSTNNQWTKVEYIDVRFPRNPVIKFR